jgi:hypothetical protein
VTASAAGDIVKRLPRVWADLRRLGLYHVVLRLSASRWSPKRAFLLSEIEILRLAEPNAKALARAPVGYEWRCADASLTDALRACAPPDTQPTLFSRFFRQGARCYVAIHRSRVVAYMWAFSGEYVLTYDSYRSRNLTIRLEPRSVFLGNGMIDEQHRLRGLFPHLVAFVRGQWPRGTELYSAVERANQRSLRSHYRLGFVPCARVLCVTVLGRSRFFTRAGSASPWRARRSSDPISLSAPALAAVSTNGAGSERQAIGRRS